MEKHCHEAKWARSMFNMSAPFAGLVQVTTEDERLINLNALNEAIRLTE